VKLDDLTPWLFSRTSGGVRWGLERTEKLLAGVGNPHRLFHSIHVGGTNGKGSTAAFCDAALRAEGRMRIGLYTSPHLICFNERIRIDGVPVADEVLSEVAERMRPAIEAEGATFFEATTAIAFTIFAEAGVDLAVVEVGLGGRLDSTNVLEPLVCVVTNIDRDHTEYLGDELSGIAREKGGIFKRGVPAITGVREPELLEVLRESAREAATELTVLDEVTRVEVVESGPQGMLIDLRSGGVQQTLRIPLPGEHQARNAALAAETLKLLPEDLRPSSEAIERGFSSVRWSGRLQVERVRGTTFLFDVAHNPAGMRTLVGALTEMDLPRPLVGVLAVLSDKDWREMLRPLSELCDAVILTTAPTAPAGRRWDPEEAAEWAAQAIGVEPRVIPSLSAAIERAVTLGPHGSVIVTGSVHTVGDALDLLDLPAV
jgi:dihydrofolate synthase/folylpolyglutamate synthase